MKRDMELVRRILQAVEADERFHHCNIGLMPEELVEDVNADALKYHVRVLIDGGYLLTSPASGLMPLVQGLTWKGHDFVEATRVNSIWDQVVAAGKKVGGMTIDLALEMARDLLRKAARGLVDLA